MRTKKLHPSTLGFLVFLTFSVIFGIFHSQIAYLIDIWGLSGKAPALAEDKLLRVARDKWRLLAASSVEVKGEKVTPELAWDGKPETFWHSEWSSKKEKLPQSLAIDMGSEVLIFAFEYTPRAKMDNGRIRNYRFHVSDDGTTWKTAAEGSFPQEEKPQMVRLQPPRPARFVKMEALSEVKDRPLASIAELAVLTVK